MSPYVTILKSFLEVLDFFLPVWENKLIKDNEMKVKGKKKSLCMVHLSVMKHGL